MNSGFADLNTHKLFYKIKGSGQKILLITGTNSDTRHSPTIYDVPGAENYQILNFDHRGMGQSTSPPSNPSLEEYADDIDKLLDHVGWEKTIVIGISFGGMVAQHFARRHTHRVSRLILCCTSSGGAGGSSFPLHEIADFAPEEYARFIMKKMDIKHTDEWQLKNPKKADRAYQFYLRGAAAAQSTAEKHEAMKKQFESRAKHDVYEALKDLNVPVYVACGEDDGVAPVDNSRALAEILPNATLNIFRGGHMFLREDPKAWPSLFQFIGQAKCEN